MTMRLRARLALTTVTLGLGALTCSATRLAAPPSAGARQTPRPGPAQVFQITARKFSFSPTRIEVTEGDLVRIELRTEDIAHSLTIDAYRIAKRVDAGHPSVLEFRAEQAGTFPFYCNLQIDDGCRKMRGELTVRKKR